MQMHIVVNVYGMRRLVTVRCIVRAINVTMERNQMKEIIKSKLRVYDKEDLVEILSEVCINNTILGRINALSSQQCIQQNIETSFIRCRKLIDEVIKEI
jgi:hypothetical protein